MLIEKHEDRSEIASLVPETGDSDNESEDKMKIKEFNVSWEADHEQYWQGHGVSFSTFDACVTGSGDTLREALDDAFEMLAQEDIELTTEQEADMLVDLESQVRQPSCIDMDIISAECQHEEPEEDCSVCAGEWHYYVSIDYTEGN